jgi:hypothetical protein
MMHRRLPTCGYEWGLAMMHRRLKTCGYGKSRCRLSTCTWIRIGCDAPQVTNLRLRDR